MNNYYPFINTLLPYDYSFLEPFIDEKTMHLHHDKHLQTYIDKLNLTLEENPKLQSLSLTQLIKNSCKFNKKLQESLRNNGGGVYNHRFYFDGLTKDCEPVGELSCAINRCFGDFKSFKAEFKKAALAVFGSGYTWLVADGTKLKIISLPNQNCPIERCLCPIMNIDVWEHAYYLKHYNMRANYIDDWFNIINWQRADERFRCGH